MTNVVKNRNEVVVNENNNLNNALNAFSATKNSYTELNCYSSVSKNPTSVGTASNQRRVLLTKSNFIKVFSLFVVIGTMFLLNVSDVLFAATDAMFVKCELPCKHKDPHYCADYKGVSMRGHGGTIIKEIESKLISDFGLEIGNSISIQTPAPQNTCVFFSKDEDDLTKGIGYINCSVFYDEMIDGIETNVYMPSVDNVIEITDYNEWLKACYDFYNIPEPEPEPIDEEYVFAATSTTIEVNCEPCDCWFRFLSQCICSRNEKSIVYGHANGKATIKTMTELEIPGLGLLSQFNCLSELPDSVRDNIYIGNGDGSRQGIAYMNVPVARDVVTHTMYLLIEAPGVIIRPTTEDEFEALITDLESSIDEEYEVANEPIDEEYEVANTTIFQREGFVRIETDMPIQAKLVDIRTGSILTPLIDVYPEDGYTFNISGLETDLYSIVVMQDIPEKEKKESRSRVIRNHKFHKLRK